MFTTDNNIYIGGTNVLLEWGKVPTDKSELLENELKEKLLEIKNEVH